MTLSDMIIVFCGEREKLRNYMKSEKFLKASTLDNDALIDYFIDLWISDAKQCRNVGEFDTLLRRSLRMSLREWMASL